jgi:hypothetical protein
MSGNFNPFSLSYHYYEGY